MDIDSGGLGERTKAARLNRDFYGKLCSGVVEIMQIRSLHNGGEQLVLDFGGIEKETGAETVT